MSPGSTGRAGWCAGMLVNNQTDQRTILESLAKAFQFEGFESEGKLKFVMGLNARTVALDAGGAGAARGPGAHR